MARSDAYERHGPGRQGGDGGPGDAAEFWPPLDEITGALENLTAVLDVEDDFQVLLHQVCRQVTRALADVDEATVTVLNDGKPYTAATTSERVVHLDRDQYSAGNGPCMEAARTGTVVRVAMEEAEDRWPGFVADSRRAGFGSFLSAPMVVGTGFAGAINCYSRSSHGFADIDEQLLELYTTAVEAALRTHRRYREARETTEQLREALNSRAVIEQAKGILMAVHKIDADEAFALLARRSQRENTKLHAIAERLVTEASRPAAP